MAVLIVALGVPSSAWTALAQDDQGPQTPPPSQQPEPPKPPTGEAQPAPKPQAPPPVAISVRSTLVNVDAVVTDHDGNLVTGLKQDNFRILDDGQPQQITNFSPTDAPITIVMLVEFSAAMGGYFGYKAQYWADGFLQQLQPKDWVALKTFDLRSTLQVDFTQDKRQVDQAIRTLGFPGFHEADLFDAVYETLDQLRDVHGKKSIFLATGCDTFAARARPDPTRLTIGRAIFCVGMGEEIEVCRGMAAASATSRRKTSSPPSGASREATPGFPASKAR